MRYSRRILAATIVAAIAASCTSSTPVSSPLAAASAAASAPASVEPLKIGLLVPFTESALESDLGASQKRAAELYLKLQGGRLGGRDVQLVSNDESTLDPAVNQVRIKQFLDQDHVALLMGGIDTPAAYLLRDAADSSKLVYIDTNATADALTRTTAGCAPSCKSTYVFRTSSTSWQMSEPLGEWASKSGQRDFSLAYADDAFGNESASAFVEGLAKNGGKATGRNAVPPGSGDWPKVVAAIKGQPAKSVFAAFVGDDADGFLAAWDRAGMRASGYRLFGPGPLTDAEVLKATKRAALGVTTSFPWSTELDNPENKAFVREFEKAYTDEDTGQPLAPDGYAVEMWDAMTVLDLALARTKGDTKDASAFIAALEAVSFRSPRGVFAFDPDTHDPVEDVYIREVRASGATLVNAIVERVTAVRDPGK